MTPQDIEALHTQIKRVKALDKMLNVLARRAEDRLEELGEKVIAVLGRNSIIERKDWVGEVTFVAVFNAIRAEREALRESLKGRVDVPETIHKVQQVQEQT